MGGWGLEMKVTWPLDLTRVDTSVTHGILFTFGAVPNTCRFSVKDCPNCQNLMLK